MRKEWHCYEMDYTLNDSYSSLHIIQRKEVFGKNVTCVCDHLTSFGVMMDFNNKVKADDPGKFIF